VVLPAPAGPVTIRDGRAVTCWWRPSTAQEPRPSPCGNCDQRHETDWEQAWPGVIRQDQEQDQDQAVPEQKATSWLSRLRR
jgi:hypothetical protein